MNFPVAKIGALLGVLVPLIGAAFWIFDYHGTLSTKSDLNLIYIELRIKDAEDAIYYLSSQQTLTGFEQQRYERVKSTIARLESERDKIVGVGGN